MSTKLTLVSVLSGTALLASCGTAPSEPTNTGMTQATGATNMEMTGTTDVPMASNDSTVGMTSGSDACAEYLEYLSCTYKKSGIDDASIQSMIDNAKVGFAALTPEESQKVCQDSIDFEKQQPIEGC